MTISRTTMISLAITMAAAVFVLFATGVAQTLIARADKGPAGAGSDITATAVRPLATGPKSYSGLAKIAGFVVVVSTAVAIWCRWAPLGRGRNERDNPTSADATTTSKLEVPDIERA